MPSPDPWSDPRLLGWVDNEIALEVFKTAEVAQLSATLAESLTSEFLRKLAARELLDLDAALVTDAGFYALRTLVAGVIVARYPSNGGDVFVDGEMLLDAFKRVAEVISSCSVDGPLASYEQPGAILAYELLTWRFVIAVPELDTGAGSPELDDEREMLLALASAVVSSNVPAERKIAQISAAIAAAC